MENNSDPVTLCPASDEPPQAPTRLRDAPIVIVGGGPVGLLAAAMLTHRGATDVTVIERAPDPKHVNNARSYTFALVRAHRVIAKCPRLRPRLEAVAAVRMAHRVATLGPGDKISSFTLTSTDKDNPLFFLRRADCVAALCDYLAAECPSVKLRAGTAVERASFDADGTTTLSVRGADGGTDTLKAALVLACDGAGSGMLKALRASADSPWLRSKAGFDDTAFDIYSSKLRVKSIVLRPEARAAVAAAVAAKPGESPLPDSAGFALDGCGAPAFRVSSMAMSDHAVGAVGGYLGMIATHAGAPVHAVRDVDAAFDLFQANFPQLRVRDCIAEDAMRDFVSAGDGWRLGSVRRANSLAAVVGKDGVGGIVALGDAAQAAPPDLGQGVNSGMEDVGVLMALIDAAGPETTFGMLAREYERVREPDIDGLMYFNKHVAKWQFSRSMCVELFLWRLGLIGRTLLSKILPRVFYPPMVLMLRNAIPYAEMQRRAEVTTARIWMAVAVAAGAVGAVTLARHDGLKSINEGLRGLLPL